MLWTLWFKASYRPSSSQSSTSRISRPDRDLSPVWGMFKVLFKVEGDDFGLPPISP